MVGAVVVETKYNVFAKMSFDFLLLRNFNFVRINYVCFVRAHNQRFGGGGVKEQWRAQKCVIIL